MKDSKGKEYSFKADSKAAMQMNNLKSGDHVKVDYRKSHGQMVATNIVEESTAAR